MATIEQLRQSIAIAIAISIAIATNESIMITPRMTKAPITAKQGMPNRVFPRFAIPTSIHMMRLRAPWKFGTAFSGREPGTSIWRRRVQSR